MRHEFYFSEVFYMSTQQNNYAATNRHKVKMVALCAMLLAIGAILDSYLKIPLLGDALQLKFAFIAFAIAGMLYGPWVGLWFGLALDTLSCIFQGGFSLVEKSWVFHISPEAPLPPLPRGRGLQRKRKPLLRAPRFSRSLKKK